MTTEPETGDVAGTKRRPRKKKLAPEKRYLKVQEAAYLLAERDDFQRDAVEYWLEAEAEVGG